MPYITAEVYVDFADFTDDDLVAEINRRGLYPEPIGDRVEEVVRDIYQRRQLGLGYDKQLEDLFDLVLGRLT